MGRDLSLGTLDVAPYVLAFAKDESDALLIFADRPPDVVIAD